MTYTDGTTEKISEEAYMALLSEMSAKLDARPQKLIICRPVAEAVAYLWLT